MSSPIRDRIKELRRVPAGSLRANPRNWRTHPEPQRRALAGVLAEIGYADALVARELPDSHPHAPALELIDGHLRAELTPEALVPVLVLDVTEAEANLLLAALDPLAAMAEADAQQLASLLREVQTGEQDLADMLGSLAEEHGILAAPEPPEEAEPALSETYAVQVECASETEQRRLFERLRAEGHACRLLVV